MRQATWVVALAVVAGLTGTAAAQEKPPKLGIVPDYTDTAAGVLIAEVVAESVAARAELKAGDRITELAGKPVKGIPDYLTAMKGVKKGDAVELRVARNGIELTVTAKFE